MEYLWNGYKMFLLLVVPLIYGSLGVPCKDPFLIKWAEEETCYFKSSPRFTVNYEKAVQKCSSLDSELVELGDWWERKYILEIVMRIKDNGENVGFWVKTFDLDFNNSNIHSPTPEGCPAVLPEATNDVVDIDCGRKMRYVCRRGNYTGKTSRPRPIIEHPRRDPPKNINLETNVLQDNTGNLVGGKAVVVLFGCLFILFLIAAVVVATVLVKRRKRSRRSFELRKKEGRPQRDNIQPKKVSPGLLDVHIPVGEGSDAGSRDGLSIFQSVPAPEPPSPGEQGTPPASARTSTDALLPEGGF